MPVRDGTTAKGASAAWAPLREPVFRTLWLAAFASNVGTWMQNVGAAWLMTSLTPSAVMVALVQAATSLPIFLATLPAGAAADVLDRRKLLLVAQGWMLCAAGVLGALTLLGSTTPPLLLALTFALGLGTAVNSPTWQAIQPSLVPPEELPAAVSLGSLGFNLARAVGPTLGGLVVAVLGPGAVFLLNAASFIAVLCAIYRWRKKRPTGEGAELPAERVLGAMRTGLRYVLGSSELRAVLVRAGAFVFSGSALWALLPLLARRELAYGALGYGLLLGCVGIGSVAGAGLLPRVRRRFSTNQTVTGATLAFAAAFVVLASARSAGLLGLAMVVSGGAWIAQMSSFGVSVQTLSPSWLRARALSTYLLVFSGSTASGSALWGSVAERIGAPAALYVAAAALVVALGVVARRWRLEVVGEGEGPASRSRHHAAGEKNGPKCAD